MKLRKIADLAGSMVHLHIIIKVVVSIPRSLDGVGPQPLKVGWQQVLACGADEQVTPEMEIAHGQPWVVVDEEVFPMVFQGFIRILKA
jgi:hypothetical protein